MHRKIDYVLVDSTGVPRRLTFLEAVRHLKAEPSEPGMPIAHVEEQHFQQVGRALELYNQMLLQQDTTTSMRINIHDNKTAGALKFLRTEAINAMSDEHGKELCRRLKATVELGEYNSLPRELADLAKQQRSKEPLDKETLEQRIIDLADTYCPDIEEEDASETNYDTPDIIISETFMQ